MTPKIDKWPVNWILQKTGCSRKTKKRKKKMLEGIKDEF